MSTTGRTAAEQLERARDSAARDGAALHAGASEHDRAKRLIAELEKKVEQESLAQPLSPSAPRRR